MNITETGRLLAEIQAFNNRTVDKAVILAWQKALADCQLTDCLRAVTAYFQVSKEWIMPSDIIDRVNDYREERRSKFPSHMHLTDRDEQAAMEAGTWAANNRALLRMAGDGDMTPADYQAYQDGKLELHTLIRKELNQ